MEEPISTRDELRNLFRMLCLGRPHAAEVLADKFAPVLDAQPVALPVIDMPAPTPDELSALPAKRGRKAKGS